jgi:hypothetical protein
VFRLDQALKVYLHREPIDFRLNINGLALLVEKALGLDPFAPCAYVFSNRRRNRVKILGWERNGFWLLLKRLEQDRFIWPSAGAVLELTPFRGHLILMEKGVRYADDQTAIPGGVQTADGRAGARWAHAGRTGARVQVQRAKHLDVGGARSGR